jgi:hypothetical protein
MLHTAELDMAETVTPNGANVFLDNAVRTICSNYHTVLKASQGAAIFGRDMLFDIPFIANWNKMGSTKRNLCGIVLFKLNTFLVMFLRVPSIDSTCFPCTYGL